MSKAPLPNKVDPRRSADQGVSYADCHLPLNRLSRLTSFLVDSDGDIDVSLFFGVDEQRQRYLSGTAAIKVNLLCQRCLEPVAVQLNAELNLGIVSDEEDAKNLPQRYDPLLIESEFFDPASAVEDELILTLPIVPLHDDCEVKKSYGDEQQAAEDDKKENPFSILAQLKGKKH